MCRLFSHHHCSAGGLFVSSDSINSKNNKVGLIILAIGIGMLGLAYGSVPLYDLFCRVTGFGGTVQIRTEATQSTQTIGGGERQVSFNANVNPELEWRVTTPAIVEKATLGEEYLVNYIATNLTDKPLTGTATFNVTPHKVGPYFIKLECFCFTEQTLMPGETAEMFVRFLVDPAINDDINTKKTPEITLSYTFFLVKKDEDNV